MAVILFAEDETFLAEALKTGLQAAGHTVLLAPDGVQAVKMIREYTVDLMLLDLVMPNKNGFEVLEDLNKTGDIAKQPVIVLTNLSNPEDKKRVLSLGARDYLVKSDFGLEAIAQKVSEFLS